MDLTSGLKSLSVVDDSPVKMKSSEESTATTEKTPAEEQVKETAVRHCAYCLNPVPLKDIKKCSRCHKRAYCGKECQTKDWTAKDGGQGHKNWCGLNCREEDEDWEVAPIPGKGLGLIAKRLLVRGCKIMVEGPRPLNHPKIMELMPLNGSLQQKVDFNCLCTEDNVDLLCLRTARANHACYPNADHHFDQIFNVNILFAEREISPGEEICVSYNAFKDVTSNMTPEASRFQLASRWGIICPGDCFCRNKEAYKLLVDGRAMYARLFPSATAAATEQRNNSEDELDIVKQLLNSIPSCGGGLATQIKLLYEGYQITTTLINTKSDTLLVKYSMEELKQARVEFIETAYGLQWVISSPKSHDALKYRACLAEIGYIVCTEEDD